MAEGAEKSSASSEETWESFGARLGSIVESGFLCVALGIGERLKLFDHLSDQPRTSAQIAKSAGLRERYVREWLGAMVCGGIVDVDPSGSLFSLPQHRRPSLNSGLMKSVALLPMWGRVSEGVEECFRLDGPSGMAFDAYEPFYRRLDQVSKLRAEQHLIQDLLPLVPGAAEALAGGGRWLELGCGSGEPSRVLAQTFPDATVIAVDLSEDAVRRGSSANKEMRNLEFRQMDGAKLAEEWGESFDVVAAFDAVHDQADPHGSLRHVFRVLKPGGWLIMLDIQATSNVAKDRAEGHHSSMWTLSLLHCLPVSLQDPEGLGLGAMYGEERAVGMLEEAGFPSPRLVHPAWEPGQTYFLCRKPPPTT